MAFPRGPLRGPTPVRIKVAVFAVGRRVFVACAGDRAACVSLTDANEKPLETVRDGTEVAILAWRPGWNGTTRYHVRATDSAHEGWLSVHNLRATKVAVPAAPTAPPRPAVSPVAPTREALEESGRRFGQRRHAQ